MNWTHHLLRRAFGRPRGVLGRLGGIIMARLNSEAAADVIDRIGIGPQDKVLELGFGPGVGIQLLAERLSTTGAIRGVDPSPEMLEQAARRNAQAIRRGIVELTLGSADSLPFAGDTFDKALAVNSFQLWANPAQGLREAWRVMRPSGKLALCFTHHSGQPNEGIADKLLEAGFVNVDVVTQVKWFIVLASKPADGGGAKASRAGTPRPHG